MILIIVSHAKLNELYPNILNNLFYNSTISLPFETNPEDFYTLPLIREHHDSHLYFINSHPLPEIPD